MSECVDKLENGGVTMLRVPNEALWAILRPLLRLILRIKLYFLPARARMKQPFVLLCNHASWYDPLLAAVCVNRPLCFCGADPAPRSGLLLRLARRLRQPDALDWRAALKEAGQCGYCVGLFPEGERCIDGVTGPIPGELAAEIRKSGLGLVVLRLEGAYLTAPRWADEIPRRGRLRARLIRRLEPAVLRAMETEQLQAMLEQDLYEDAFATARRRPGPYRGERTAERLEKLLCVCPKCGAVGTMESRDNEFSCRACGFGTVFLLSGRFRGGNVPFETPLQWSRWQNERIRLLCGQAGDGVIFEDGGYEICDLRDGGERIGTGGLHLYRDRLELPTGIAVSRAELLSLRLVGGSGLRVETKRGSVFELRTLRPVCAQKYITALAFLAELPAPEKTEAAELPAPEKTEAAEPPAPEKTEEVEPPETERPEAEKDPGEEPEKSDEEAEA